MQGSEVPLYPAAGKLERLFNFPRLHQVFLDFGLGKKKCNTCAVSIKRNQENCQNLCRAGALIAGHSKANLV